MSKKEETVKMPGSGHGARGAGRKKQPVNPATAKRLLGYFGKYKGTMVLIIFAILVSSFVSVVSSVFLQRLIDGYIMPLLQMAHPIFTPLIRALSILTVIYVIGVLSSFCYNWLMVKVAQNILKEIRDEMFAKMQKLPIRFFDSNTHGDLMSHYTNDTDALRQMLGQSIPNIVAVAFTVITTFFAMLYLSVYLTGIVLLVLLLIMFLLGKVAGKSGTYFFQQQESLGALNGYVEEMVNGQKVVKVFCHEEKALNGFREKNEAWRENSTKAHGISSMMMPMMNAVGSVQYVILAIAGGMLAVLGVPNLTLLGFDTMSLGTITAFLIMARNFTNPIAQAAGQMNAVVMVLAGATRIFALLDAEPEVDEGNVTLVNAKEEAGQLVETQEETNLWAWKQPKEDGSVVYTKLQGGVVFDKVDFRYVPDKPVLHDISLYAKPGQKIAFVGATGAGKTTITNLLNRFYDIDDGRIRYDGININKIKKADLRRSLGLVLQDVTLFTDTVMENIRYGKPDATDEDCILAAKRANADRFISLLPEGYQTVLEGDGSGLSQGQRQLLSIARAAVSNPPVMILDEATSSIDTRTEVLVQRGMDALMDGRTVFVIAHRLSTVQNSKAIMVMDHGRIIERGNHDELIDLHGIYYQLYTGGSELE